MSKSIPNSSGDFAPQKRWCFEKMGMNFITTANADEDNNMSNSLVKGLSYVIDCTLAEGGRRLEYQPPQCFHDPIYQCFDNASNKLLDSRNRMPE